MEMKGGLFRAIDDAVVIISRKGVYKQVPLYKRGGILHAKVLNGFVRLRGEGDTSSPLIKWSELLSLDGGSIKFIQGRYNQLEITEAKE